MDKLMRQSVGYLLILYSLNCFAIDNSNIEFLELSLEELANIEITSVAKKPQKRSQAASSIFVLTQEDIHRSGVTTIADALRLVPGVQVAKLDANKWAISIRGFNDIFSNKLLVLMDGRSVYSPLFGGTYWDAVDTILEDIERIEVIKGSGGTIWGANAVNGVINIITKNAKDTQGGLLSVLVGNEERGKIAMRYGGEITPELNYRVYAKGFEKDEAENGSDDWRMGQAGFRFDAQATAKDKLTLQSDVYIGEEGELAESLDFGTFPSETEVFGVNVLFKWDRAFDDDSNLSFQAYYDRTERERFYLSDIHDTLDVDFQHRFQTFWQQEIIWGLGFRYIDDETTAGTLMSLNPTDRSVRIYSAFIQDEISLIKNRLILTIGSKFEHNSYTGFEYQPSARLLFKINEQHSIWGAVSRSVRVPARVEHDFTLKRKALSSNLNLNVVGSKNFKPEELLAYELGYRFINKAITLDVSLFYNNYNNLRSIEPASIVAGNPSVLPFFVENKLDSEVYGAEVALSWQVMESLRLHGSYSYVQIQSHPLVGSRDTTEERDEGDTPHHQFTIRSLWQPHQDWQVDTTIRYVDMIKEVQSPVTYKPAVKSYVTLDLRLAWQFDKNLEFSLVGHNLLGKHREFRNSIADIQATDVEPSVFFKADFHF
ncbi:MAG: TonB-dependent receptor [Methylococcaceae bacterium]|nr:TonB-dependent receptor [Methylococcaceae bacterium]